jgi:hypothetical protein
MLLRGLWHLCDDGVIRPVIRGEVEAGDGSWVQVPFLVDTAADRIVFSADILAALRLQPLVTSDRLSGVGGSVASVVVESQIQSLRDDAGRIRLRGRYAAFTELEALDMSVLGRDITNLFAVIVDRPRDFVGLLGQRHQYVIQEQ